MSFGGTTSLAFILTEAATTAISSLPPAVTGFSATATGGFPQVLPQGIPPSALKGDRGPGLNAIDWALTGAAALFLFPRCWCKFLGRRGLWWDDYFLIGAWISIVISSAITSSQISFGLGKHILAVPPQNLAGAIGISGSLAATFSIISAVWGKTSFAITLLRLTKGWVKAFVWFSIITMNVAMAFTAVFQWAACQPIRKTWDPTVPGTCWDRNTLVDYNIFSSAYSGFMDLLLALLPWTIIMGLQMKRAEKLGVTLAMSLGVFAASMAFVKCTKIPALDDDITFSLPNLVVWVTAEACTTIMAASIPTLRVLVKDLKVMTTKIYSSRNRNGARRLRSDSTGSRTDSRAAPGSSPSRSRARKAGNHVIITSTSQRGSTPGKLSALSDDSSAKSILGSPSGGNSPVFAIVQKNEMKLEYDARWPGEDLEMGRIEKRPRNSGLRRI